MDTGHVGVDKKALCGSGGGRGGPWDAVKFEDSEERPSKGFGGIRYTRQSGYHCEPNYGRFRWIIQMMKMGKPPPTGGNIDLC